MRVEDMMREFYYRDANEADAEIQNQPISVRLPVTHLMLLQALADRFGQTRASVGADFLEAAIEEAFSLLLPSDRTALAKKADKAYQEYCTEKYDTFDMTGPGYWSGLSLAYEKARDNNKEGE